MQDEQTKIVAGAAQFGPSHVLDLLGDQFPVDVVHSLPAPEAAEEVGLMLGPGEEIAMVEIVRHGGMLAERPVTCQ